MLYLVLFSIDITCFIINFTDTQMQLDPTIHGPLSGHGSWGTGALNVCSVF